MVTKISLAQILKISPQKINKFLVVALGNKVLKDQVIASKKSLLGKKIEVKSPVSGILQSLTSSGELLIQNQEKAKPEKTFKDEKNAFWGTGKAQGEIVWFDGNLEFTQISGELENKIIACESVSSVASLYKAAALGAVGIVVVFCEEKFTVLSEEIGFLVMEEKADKITTQNLKKLKGKKVLIDGVIKKLVVLNDKTK